MRKLLTVFCISLAATQFVVACAPGSNKLPEPEITYTPDYDDGAVIFINVKIAIDKKGWESKTPEYFKEKLEQQWEQITTRFNVCDKKHQLQRQYIFKPDLEDIIVYDGCSYWGENGADTKVVKRMNKQIFKLAVIYDFFYQGEENGEYGGGCGDYDGIGTILVINASENIKNKYNDHFDQYTYRAITHELGHFRGMIDLYTHVVEAENNPVSHEGFMPLHCLMNDYCYTPDAESAWSDYAIKIFNKTGNIKRANLINGLMYEDFAEKISISVTQDTRPANATVRFYPIDNGQVDINPCFLFTVANGSLILDSRDLFFRNSDVLWDRYYLFLVEVTVSGTRQYDWLSDYMLHNVGIDQQESYAISFTF